MELCCGTRTETAKGQGEVENFPTLHRKMRAMNLGMENFCKKMDSISPVKRKNCVPSRQISLPVGLPEGAS